MMALLRRAVLRCHPLLYLAFIVLATTIFVNLFYSRNNGRNIGQK